tara:strand:- start:367 stop:672 length:306 start_codon:yes stop_codon:yes gene_type:complete
MSLGTSVPDVTAQDSAMDAPVACLGGSGNGGNAPKKCPGCESGSRSKSDHFNHSINHFYEGCYLRETTCIWCGAHSWGDEYCSYRCISLEKKYDDAYNDYY